MDLHDLSPCLELSQITRCAARRWKWEQGKLAFTWTLAALALFEGAWAVGLIFNRTWIFPFPAAAVAASFVLILVVVHACLRRPEPKTIHRLIDRRLGLPDSALSAGELSGDNAWHARLREQTRALTSSVDWAKVWPVPWPKWTAHAGLSFLALFCLLAYSYHAELEFRRQAQSLPVPANPRTVALEALFKDWDQAKTQDEDLKKMLELVAPLRERLTAPGANEKQCFADLNRLEEIVAAEKAKLESQSLEPQAANLADALQPMEGMGALAAALRKKDFEKAAEQANQAAGRFGAGEVPKGSNEAGNATQKLAEQLGRQGQQQMSQALSQFSSGAKEGDCKKMSAGMNGMKQCLSQQACRNSECKRLSTQLAQLSFCKNPGDSQCQSGGMSLMPKISLAKQNQPGKGAGSETNLNRFGSETSLASERHAETMNNVAADGESETTTIKSASGQNEAMRTTRGVTFQEYQQLSQQAIADEAIPAAHREAIKRYFEKIRPDVGM